MYKDLTKGKAAPMGGVAYLNLEDSEVSGIFLLFFSFDFFAVIGIWSYNRHRSRTCRVLPITLCLL